MAVVVRPATHTDRGAVLELWQAAAENRSRPADTAESVTTLLGRDPAALIVAIDGSDHLVGTIIVGWDGWRCHVYRLAVHPGHRRQGIGRLLVDAAELRAREQGATRIDAMVLDDNDLGQQIWQAAEFAVQSDWRRWVKPVG